MAMGLFILDMAAAVITDRNLIRDVVRARFGVKPKREDDE